MKRRWRQARFISYAGMLMLMMGLGATGFAASALAADKPNIDRIAKEGMLFTDHYAQPSCTAGRAAFITGRHAVAGAAGYREFQKCIPIGRLIKSPCPPLIKGGLLAA